MEKEKNIHVSPSPHVINISLTTKGMMIDVLIGLIPILGMAFYVFGLYVLKQVGICIICCLISEFVFNKMRHKPFSLKDGSALITGLILGLSFPWSASWYISVIASITAIGLGKIVFGGLGQNIFNPAMVGRAFVMISFPVALGASAYLKEGMEIAVLTQATPLTAFKQLAGNTPLWPLFIGNVNGSLGETSALACLIGGIYLCIRKTASFEVPLGTIMMVILIGGISNILNPETNFTVWHHLVSGALLFGAFFIATDPVTNPLTPKGKFIFGLGFGFFVMLFRLFSGYPEGVMFAILIMNGITPLINRWTIPKPVGGEINKK